VVTALRAVSAPPIPPPSPPRLTGPACAATLAIPGKWMDDDRIMRFHHLALISTGILLMTAGCDKPGKPAAEPEPARQSYSVTGQVMSLRPLEKEVVIKHQRIPGYMMAMTMPFSVRETNTLTGLIPGEEITFQLIVTKDDAWIEDIEKTGVAENIVPEGAPIRIAREVEPLEIGEALPDYHLVNEQGRAVSLNQFKGNTLLLSFLFTRCPVPNFCPLTARKLASVQDRLLAMNGGPTNWHILAITLDPEYDTPARLKQFGETYGYKPEHWSLLTGELIDITALAEQFGLLFWNEDGTVNHNLRTVVVGADGLIRTNIIGNEWTVETVVNAVVGATTPQQ